MLAVDQLYYSRLWRTTKRPLWKNWLNARDLLVMLEVTTRLTRPRPRLPWGHPRSLTSLWTSIKYKIINSTLSTRQRGNLERKRLTNYYITRKKFCSDMSLKNQNNILFSYEQKQAIWWKPVWSWLQTGINWFIHIKLVLNWLHLACLLSFP